MLIKNNTYTHLAKAIRLYPDFEYFVEEIINRSEDINSDLEAVEYLLATHNIEDVHDFLPRFISLL